MLSLMLFSICLLIIFIVIVINYLRSVNSWQMSIRGPTQHGHSIEETGVDEQAINVTPL